MREAKQRKTKIVHDIAHLIVKSNKAELTETETIVVVSRAGARGWGLGMLFGVNTQL